MSDLKEILETIEESKKVEKKIEKVREDIKKLREIRKSLETLREIRKIKKEDKSKEVWRGSIKKLEVPYPYNLKGTGNLDSLKLTI